MKTNKELDLAWQYVNTTDRHIFLTGKAGTGKTTFLHNLKKDSLKRMIVVAPTGVAAINAKGVTIHSFFQLPFGPILPSTALHNKSNFKYRFSKTKIDLIKSTDLLVIDEISMVRCDLLDGIDSVLRRYRDRNRPFGGIQVLMIGDLQQLSPVVNANEWQLLNQHYDNAYFFSSHVFQKSRALTIELTHIYRQEDPIFIKILNEIRNDQLSSESTAELNKRVQADFEPTQNDGYISLTTHNRKAESINTNELRKLKSDAHSYHATVKDKFPESSFPNDAELVLKVGAQVMFIKNDSSPEKRYYNGKIGKVVWLSEDEVSVQCPDEEHPISVTPETWENIQYGIDQSTKEVTENLIGSYSQMPLRLAWSITIHKSQGLTFERAVIDAESAFAHGQTYVALSRCKSLEGLVLKSRISSDQIISDHQVSKFNEESTEHELSYDELLNSKIEFQRTLIHEIFNFFPLIYPVKRMLDVYYKNRGVVFGQLEDALLKIQSEATQLLKIASAFKAQVEELTGEQQVPEDSPTVQERFKKAINYFQKRHQEVLMGAFDAMGFSTDNSSVEKDLQKSMSDIEQFLKIKSSYFSQLATGFKVEEFLELRAKSQLEVQAKPQTKIRKIQIADDVSHPQLFEILRELRHHLATSENLIHYQIFNQKSLIDMCNQLPTTEAQLLKINGMGKVRVKKYGSAILEEIRDYCEARDIDFVNQETIEIKEKTPKVDTKEQSLQLFRSGLNIEEIAEKRDLNPNTIFGHLTHFIPSGEIHTTDLMSKERFDELSAIIPTKTFEGLSELKSQLDEKFSYAEIKLVLRELQP